MDRPPPLRTDLSNAFAHNTIRVRLPAILRETALLNLDYSNDILTALERLALDLETDAPIPTISDPLWQDALNAHKNNTWQGSEWFYAETYCYRLLLDAVRWHETRRDPFAPKKVEEITSAAMRTALFVAFEMTPEPPDERLADRILRALWGNRIDLSFNASMEHGSHGADDDLLIDHRRAVVTHIRRNRGRSVHLIADNTGTELAMDWLLIDALLDFGEDGTPYAERVTLHVKVHPTFVSDATRDDALTLLAELGGRGSLTPGFGSHAAAIAERLQAAMLDGRLTIREDFFWNSAHFMFDAPPSINALFEDAALVISKGDANYRRFVGDALWDAATPFEEVTAYFPAPLLTLRTLKSDPVAGLQPGQADALNSVDPKWRVNGRRGVASFGGRK